MSRLTFSDRHSLTALGEAVTKALVLLSVGLANPKPITPDLIEFWVMALQSAGIRADEVYSGAAKLAETETFFPSPAQLIAVIHPPEDEAALDELGWQRVLQCVRGIGGGGSLIPADLDGDACALWALSRMNWPRLCSELGDENRSILRAEFVRLYRVGRLNGATCDYVVGRHELENARSRDLTPELVGRPDWPALPSRQLQLGEGLPLVALTERERAEVARR